VTSIFEPEFYYISNNKELLRRITDIVQFKEQWVPEGEAPPEVRQKREEAKTWSF